MKLRCLSRCLALFLLVSGSLRCAVVCASCHPEESRAYAISAMGRSIGSPDRVPAGAVEDRQSGARIRTEWRQGKLVQLLSEDGVTVEYEIGYQIGAGRVGHSYGVIAGDFLLEAPASYYNRFGWDASPGYAGSELLDINRVLTERCLFCHSNPREIYRGGRFAPDDLEPVSCERCHGDTAAHLKRPSAKNIVNPAKLPGRARDSVCEQCHLEGVARVLNPGKRLTDFQPGSNLEDTLAIYVASGDGQDARAVSQEEQLAASRCAMESGGKLWCGTCHNPHAVAKDRPAELRSVCQSCHPVLSPVAHVRVSECVSCHMPRRTPKDVAHAALTDHRIRRRPDETPKTTLNLQDLRAWRQPAPEQRERDLALASWQAALGGPGMEPLREKAISELQALPESARMGDSELAEALGSAALATGHGDQAIALFSQAVQLAPDSAEYAMNLGLANKEAGNLERARQQFERTIQLDPSMQRAYIELSAIASKQGDKNKAAAVLDSYLHRNPQSVLIRLMRQALEPGRR